MRAITKEALWVILSLLLGLFIVVFYFGQSVSLVRLGKAGLGVGAQLVSCPETGYAPDDYREELDLAYQSKRMTDYIRLLKEAKECFPNEDFATGAFREKDTFILSTGEAIAWCISPVLKSTIEIKCKEFSDAKDEFGVITCLKKEKIIQSLTASQKCTKAQFVIGTLGEEKYCLDKNYQHNNQPAIMLQPTGGCPETFDETAVQLAQEQGTAFETYGDLEKKEIGIRETGILISTKTKDSYVNEITRRQTYKFAGTITNLNDVPLTITLYATTDNPAMRVTRIGKPGEGEGRHKTNTLARHETKQIEFVIEQYEDTATGFSLYVYRELPDETKIILATIPLVDKAKKQESIPVKPTGIRVG